MATNRKKKRKKNIVEEVGSAVHMFEAISFVLNASAKWKTEQSWKLEKFALREREREKLKKEKIIKCIFRVLKRAQRTECGLCGKKNVHAAAQSRHCGRRHTHILKQSGMPPKICDNWRFPIDKQICRNFNRLSLSLNNHSVDVAHFAAALEKEDYRGL